MSTIITDGTGKGYKLRVDQSNRVRSHAITESEQLHAIEEGDGYNVNTGLISITGDATLLYIKNNDEADLVIDTIIIGTGQGITHSDSPYAYLHTNITGGDLISDATTVDGLLNRNGGSNNTLIGDTFKGKTGGTATGGNNAGPFQLNTTGRTVVPLNWVLRRGNSLAITTTPNISSGSANYYAAAVVYVKDDTTD